MRIKNHGSSLKEWLVSNGVGGYASSTVIGLNTRTYHGLLVASIGGLERILVVSSLDEEVLLGGGEVYRLAVHKYPGTIHPRGFNYLEEFRLKPNPTFVYQAGGVRVLKTVEVSGNAVRVSYQVDGECTIRVCPLVNLRSFHNVTRAGELSFRQTPERHGTTLTCLERGDLALNISSEKAEYQERGVWYYNFEYDREKERGLGEQEDNYSPGVFEIKLGRETDTFSITAQLTSTPRPQTPDAPTFFQPAPSFSPWKNRPPGKPPEYVASKTLHSFSDSKSNESLKELEQALERTASSFIVKKNGELTIIAGYHWFSEWGRDAMISLPGLTLVTGRFGEAKQILKTMAYRCKNGIIPNYLEGETASYNTSDASLWFIHALGEYYRYTGDAKLLGELLPAVQEIIQNYKKGTNNIKMEKDGLIHSPASFTWMDAKIDNTPVTPRQGKPVEINALWYHALLTTAKLTRIKEKRRGQVEPEPESDPENHLELASRVKKSFLKFWNEKKQCLHDVIDTPSGRNDPTLRPNQILAVYLQPSPLPPAKQRSVLEAVTKELLTPYGLRTLPPGHPDYHGSYTGPPAERDASYHQGTVWPWLLGPYITAAIKTKIQTKKEAANLLKPLQAHLHEAGLCTISEIFDADPPHHPRGCISQAWSAAEILRCIKENLAEF